MSMMPNSADTVNRIITIEVENYVREIHQDLSMVLSNTDAIRDDVGEMRQMIEDQQSNAASELAELEANQIREWLTKCDPQSTYDQCLSKMSFDSGKWFLEYAFDDWLDNASANQVLWLRGRSGSGKTTLLSAAIRYLQTRRPWATRPLSAYFYCSFAAKETQSPSNVIGSFISQLLDQIEDFPMIAKAAHASAALQEPSPSKRPSIEELESLLIRGCSSSQKKILVFLDAPNESNEADEIIESLARVTTKCSNFRLMIASTPDLDLRHIPITTPLTSIYMSFGNVNQDISTYVDQRISQEKRLRRLPAVVQNNVRMVFAESTQGSFRWAECQLDALIENARSVSQIERALQSISPTLEGLYIAALDAVPPPDRPLLRSALHWLMFATRPLRIEEISEAMIYKGNGSSLQSADRLFPESAEDIVRRCPMLIQYSATSKYAALAHSSVQQFLASEQCRLSSVGEFHFDWVEDFGALACLTMDYLNQPVFSSGYCTTKLEAVSRLREWPLFRYVSSSWPRYATMLPPGPRKMRMEDAMKSLFATFSQPRGGNFGSWVQIHLPRHLHHNQCLSHPLYYMARAGIDEVVEMILLVEGKGILELQGGSRESTPLHVACAYGRTTTVKLLLDHGADPNERNGVGERGIAWAARYNYRSIVALLLQYGAEPLEEGYEQSLG